MFTAKYLIARCCLFCCSLVLSVFLHNAQAQTTPPANVIITLTGENFTRQSTVFIGTAQFAPEFVSPNVLRVSIPKTMLSSAQPNNVRVVNPSAGGGSSAALPLVVACATNNLLAFEFSYIINQISFDELDSVKNITPINLSDGALNKIRNNPVSKRVQLESKVYKDGSHITTITDLSSANERSIFVTDMPLNSANLKVSRVTTINHLPEAGKPDTLALVTITDAAGTTLQSYPMKRYSYKTIIDMLILQPNPCTQNSSPAAASLQSITQPLSSMEGLVQQAQSNGALIESWANNRYKITMYAPFPALNIPIAAQITKIIAIINAAPDKNYIESLHCYKGSEQASSTYFLPSKLGDCATPYRAIINKNMYKTPDGTFMRSVNITEFESTNFKNYITQ